MVILYHIFGYLRSGVITQEQKKLIVVNLRRPVLDYIKNKIFKGDYDAYRAPDSLYNSTTIQSNSESYEIGRAHV